MPTRAPNDKVAVEPPAPVDKAETAPAGTTPARAIPRGMPQREPHMASATLTGAHAHSYTTIVLSARGDGWSVNVDCAGRRTATNAGQIRHAHDDHAAHSRLWLDCHHHGRHSSTDQCTALLNLATFCSHGGVRVGDAPRKSLRCDHVQAVFHGGACPCGEVIELCVRIQPTAGLGTLATHGAAAHEARRCRSRLGTRPWAPARPVLAGTAAAAMALAQVPAHVRAGPWAAR